MTQTLARAEAIVSSIRRDAREGLVLPGGENGWKLELLTAGSRRQFDTNAIIDRYDKRIATSVLADFVMLGQQQVGSFALADSKTKIFALAIGTYLDCICEVFNNQGIPRLIDINGDHFKGITDYPKMQHGDIEDTDLAAFAAFVKEMVGAGVIQPDEALEDEVRRVGNLPERMDTTPPAGSPEAQAASMAIWMASRISSGFLPSRAAMISMALIMAVSPFLLWQEYTSPPLSKFVESCVLENFLRRIYTGCGTPSPLLPCRIAGFIYFLIYHLTYSITCFITHFLICTLIYELFYEVKSYITY
jgi:hypothetical protein